MNIPDAITLDKLCREQRSIGECTDQNCDGCVLNRMICASKECCKLISNMLDDMQGDYTAASVLIAAVSCGIMLGIEFQKLQEKEVKTKERKH